MCTPYGALIDAGPSDACSLLSRGILSVSEPGSDLGRARKGGAGRIPNAVRYRADDILLCDEISFCGDSGLQSHMNNSQRVRLSGRRLECRAYTSAAWKRRAQATDR